MSGDQDFDADTSHPVLMTVDQVAAMLQVSTRTVWRMRSARQMPEPVRISGGVRWRLDEVRNWIERGCPVEWHQMQRGTS